jgi:hypothetical protein
MNLYLKIEGKNEPIEIGNEEKNALLTSIKIKFDSPNEDVLDRSSEAILKATIDGKISKDIKTETINLLKWSLTRKDDVYRKVTIRIENEEEIIREYIFTQAFVIDYSENIDKNGGSFSLILAQKGNKMNEVEVRDK